MRVSDLWNDRDGAILPYVAIMLVVIFGLSALAVDASRLMTVQTQLQSAADALALAGAAELDRRPDSIVRAEAAIHDLIVNPVPGAGLGKVAEVAGITFLRSLPPDDELPITTANLTDDPTLAAYVQVTVKPVGMAMIFPISLSPRPPDHQRRRAGRRGLRPDRLQCRARYLSATPTKPPA